MLKIESHPLHSFEVSAPSFMTSPQRKCWEVAKKISPLAKQTFLELGTALVLNVTLLTFFATPLGVPISLMLFHKVLMGTMVATVLKMAWEIYSSKNNDHDPFWKGSSQLARISITNSIGLAWPIPAIHEYLGHAVAAKILFKNPQIKVRIVPFLSGNTSYYASHLTKIGQLLGKEQAVLFVTAAGSMASTIFAMLEFGLAFGIKGEYPTLSEWLNYQGIVQILNEVIYAMTAFIAQHNNLAHDFKRLWTMGEIHPLIPIGLMIALPLLEIAFLKLREELFFQ